MQSLTCDVAVLGGGNAALCAAICARERGADVVVIECAPRPFRGGNSRHTRNLRCMHERPTELLTDAYSEDEYYTDLLRVTGGQTTEPLARLTIQESFGCPPWMQARGVRFQPPLRGTLHLGRTNAFFLGGGKALVNSYYAHAAAIGVRILYDASVVDLDIVDGHFRAVDLLVNGTPAQLTAMAVVVASGGFESNIEWLKDAWGPAAENFIIRGTPYNTGVVLKRLLERGAKRIGDATQCHAVAIDARAPKFDGGIVTRLDCVSLGIVVNAQGERFYDEGEDFWPKRYAIWGRLVAQQPGQIAYCLIDQKAVGRFMPSVFPPIAAATIAELAPKIDQDPARLQRTVDAYNAAVQPGHFDHAVLDTCHTVGLTPDKSHWAQRLDTPPYWAYPLRPGITFTYLGVQVDQHARMYMDNGSAADNIFAAGEIMAGNILGKGYLAGIGMTIGTVFGRIAGTSAAQHVRPH